MFVWVCAGGLIGYHVTKSIFSNSIKRYSLIRTDKVIALRTPAFEFFNCPFTIFHKVSWQ